MKVLAALLLSLSAVSAIELTPENWDAETAGKSVFLKFFAPWCGHCKKLKPAWDDLIEVYKDSKTALVADVDCTAEGKPLCTTHGVRGYPTIMYGDPNSLEKYSGGRDLDSLKKFAEENLKPLCSVLNIDICDDAAKAAIKNYQGMSAADLNKLISEKEQELQKAEREHKSAVSKLEKEFNEISTVEKAALSLMRSVKASSDDGKDEL